MLDTSQLAFFLELIDECCMPQDMKSHKDKLRFLKVNTKTPKLNPFIILDNDPTVFVSCGL